MRIKLELINDGITTTKTVDVPTIDLRDYNLSFFDAIKKTLNSKGIQYEKCLIIGK